MAEDFDIDGATEIALTVWVDNCDGDSCLPISQLELYWCCDAFEQEDVSS